MKKIVMFFVTCFVLLTGTFGASVICFASEADQLAETGAEIDVRDGTYFMEVSLSGGTGRASITSPAKLTVSNKTAVASIEWSSPNFDYMIVNGKQYLPVNTEGNSVFEIPVLAFDEAMDVVADTTAMSRPHEVEYTLTFHSDTIQAEQSNQIIKIIACVLIAAVVIIVVMKGMKSKHDRKKE